MNKTLEQMSGEKTPSPKLPLNEIGINGKTGQFRFRNVLAGIKEVEVDGEIKKKYEETDIGTEIDVTFLKVRRKLMQHIEGSRPLVTNEHNSKTDWVTMYGGDGGTIEGYAEDIREANQGLRTTQVVYALFKGELVRLFVKGASLGSKVKETTKEADFYSYISSFKANNRDGHFYEHETNLFALKESGKLGPYYCIGYKEGKKLDDKEMELVTDKMGVAFEYCESVDEYFKKEGDTMSKKSVSAGTDNDLPTIDADDYPDEEINPEDIPF